MGGYQPDRYEETPKSLDSDGDEGKAVPDRVAALLIESLAYAKPHILRILVPLTPIASLQESP